MRSCPTPTPKLPLRHLEVLPGLCLPVGRLYMANYSCAVLHVCYYRSVPRFEEDDLLSKYELASTSEYLNIISVSNTESTIEGDEVKPPLHIDRLFDRQ